MIAAQGTCVKPAFSVSEKSKNNEKRSFGKAIYRRSKTSLKYCFLISTLNSMGSSTLCSTIVSERLKNRKALAIHYRQDIISCVKVNNNVKNINKL